MPGVNLDKALSKTAHRLGIDTAKPFSKADAKRLRTELDDLGIATKPADLTAARERIAAAAGGAAQDAGTKTKKDRAASTGAPAARGGSGQTSTVAALRANKAPAFDASTAVVAAYRDEMKSAGVLQWRGAEAGISMTKHRWIPPDADLAAMRQTKLGDALPGAKDADATVYWPKTPKAGDHVYLSKPGMFGDLQWTSLSLRAPPGPPVAAPAPPAQGVRGVVDAVLAQVGAPKSAYSILTSSTVRNNDTLLIYMLKDDLAKYAKPATDALTAQGMKTVTHDDYGVPSRFFEAPGGGLIAFRKDEAGGAV